jgi:predicted phage terminase large subunit-like protein
MSDRTGLLSDKLKAMPASDKERLAALVEELNKRKARELAQTRFLAFVKEVWPKFIYGRHHARMAQEFEGVVNNDCNRLIINLGPRHSKSEFASYLLPAWFLGKYPHMKVMQCSNTAELAVGFGRKVRNLIASAAYQNIFPGVELQADSKAAGRWNTSAGGSYYAIGVGGTCTGLGADLLITDDPHSEQDSVIAASNPEVYDKVYEWYTSGPRQRLQPNGRIIIVQCMTGDTSVLMANGTEIPLRGIRQGDKVATYDNGRVSTARVVNWQSNGVDKVYQIKMTSGTIVRANGRHPFLVDNEGVKQWIRLKNLKPGMSIVAISAAATYPAQKSRGRVLPATKKSSMRSIKASLEQAMGSVSLRDVLDPQEHKLNPDCAAHVNQQRTTTRTTPRLHIERWATMESTKGQYVRLMGVISRFIVNGCALCTTKKSSGILEKLNGPLLKYITHAESRADMVLLCTTTKECSMNKEESALSVENLHRLITHEHTGTGSYVSTIATKLKRYVHYYAMTVTLLWDIQRQKKQPWQSQSTLEFTTDQIAEITYSSEEEVFDVQIEGTENFIANGLVSHNTRWSKRDLTGQVLAAQDKGGDQWRAISLPAILPNGKPLWPEFWTLKELEATRQAIDVSKWQAQYQQNPTSEEGALIKREWWKHWPTDSPPQTEFILQTWDTAFEKTQRADFSACTTWGVFYKDDETGTRQANIILLDAKKGRYEFPELKQIVLDEYKYWEPDSIIIEKKASGAPLIYELRSMGIPVGEFTPTRGNDKIVRLNAVADVFASGRVWIPNTRFADEVVEEVAAFPAGQNDDFVDCLSMAIALFRRGGFISTQLDKPDEIPEFRGRSSYRSAYY